MNSQIKTKSPKRSRDFSQAKIALQDLLSAGEIYQSTSKQICLNFLNLKNQYNLPSYRWAELKGWYDCQQAQWHRHKFVFCGIDALGKPYAGKWEELTEEQRKCRKDDRSLGGLFWKDERKPNGIGQPYFVSKNTGPGYLDFIDCSEQFVSSED